MNRTELRNLSKEELVDLIENLEAQVEIYEAALEVSCSMWGNRDETWDDVSALVQFQVDVIETIKEVQPESFVRFIEVISREKSGN